MCEDEIVAGPAAQPGDRCHLCIVSQWRHRLPRAGPAASVVAIRQQVHDRIEMQQNSNYIDTTVAKKIDANTWDFTLKKGCQGGRPRASGSVSRCAQGCAQKPTPGSSERRCDLRVFVTRVAAGAIEYQALGRNGQERSATTLPVSRSTVFALPPIIGRNQS
jgi:hypothetical protein